MADRRLRRLARPLKRRYWPHRRAWGPRGWIAIGLSIVLTVVICVVTSPPPLVWGVVAFVTSTVVVQAQFWLWRHKHPIVSREEQLDDIRRAAPWN